MSGQIGFSLQGMTCSHALPEPCNSDPVGRGSGSARPILWRLRNTAEAASRVKLSSESIDKLLGELPEPPALDDEDEQNCNIYSLTSAGGEGKNAKS